METLGTILSNINPTADHRTVLLSPKAVAGANVETIIVCNNSASDITFDIILANQKKAGLNESYFFNTYSLPANDTVFLNININIKQGMSLYVKASGDSTFTAIGNE